jgi:hypothetical protein
MGEKQLTVDAPRIRPAEIFGQVTLDHRER